MAADLATLGISLSNTQAIADAKATGQAMEEMGVRGETAARKIATSSNPVTEAIKKQAVTVQQARQAWAASGGDMARFTQELEKMVGAQQRITDSTRQMTLMQVQAIAMDQRRSQELARLAAAAAAVPPAQQRITDSTRQMTMMQMEAIAINQKMGQSANQNRLALGRLGNQFTSLTSQIAGVHPVVGNLTSVLGNFAYGSVLMTGILGGITIFAVLFDKITSGARKAREETERLTAALAAQFLPKTGPRSQTNLAFEGALDRRADLTRRLGLLENSSNDFEVARAFRANNMAAPFRSREKEIEVVKKDLAAVRQAIEDAYAGSVTSIETVIVKARDLVALNKKAADDEKQYQASIQQAKNVGINMDLDAARKRIDFRREVQEKIEREAIVLATKQAEEQKQIQENLIRSMQGTWSTFFQDVFTKGMDSFRDLFSGIRQLFLKLVADMMAARVMQRMAGVFGGIGMAGGGSAEGGGMLAGLGGQIAMQAAGAGVAGGLVGYGVGQAIGSPGMGALGGAAAGAAIGTAIMPGLGTAVGALAGFAGGLIGGAKAAREHAKALEQAQKELALSFADLRARVSGDTLGQAQAQNQSELQKFLLQINAALPGRANEADRNRQRAEAVTLFGQLADQINAAAQAAKQYAREDLEVQLLAAQGQDREAAALGLKYNQEREREAMIKSFGAEIDAVEATTLALLDRVHAEKKVKAAIDAVSGSMLNMVEGYKLQAVIFGAMNPRSPSSLTPFPDSPPRVGPFPSLPAGPASGDLTVKVVLADGTVIGKAVLRDFKSTAQRQFGDSSKWSLIQ